MLRGRLQQPEAPPAERRGPDERRGFRALYEDRLNDLPQILMRVYELTRHDTPSDRCCAPFLARSMAPYIFMDERSYADRLLDAVESILDRESAATRKRPTVAR